MLDQTSSAERVPVVDIITHPGLSGSLVDANVINAAEFCER
jgi:hypothetical protein